MLSARSHLCLRLSHSSTKSDYVLSTETPPVLLSITWLYQTVRLRPRGDALKINFLSLGSNVEHAMLSQRFYDIQLIDAQSGAHKASQIRIDYRHLEGALTVNLVVRNAYGIFVPVPAKAGVLPFDVVVFNSPNGITPAHVTQDTATGTCFFEVIVGLLSPVGIWIRKDVSNLKFGCSFPTPPGWHVSDRHVLILKPQEKLLGLGKKQDDCGA